MKQHYMTYPERIRLETMLRFKVPVAQIARELGCCRQTIYNEMKRGMYTRIKQVHGFDRDVQEYSADIGQQLHDKATKNKGTQLKISGKLEYAEYLEERILKHRRSPAAALAEARKAGFDTSICVTTLYAYINDGVIRSLSNSKLWEKNSRKKKKKRPEQRITHPQYPSIMQRPSYISDRKEPGHWEIDLIIGGKRSQAALMVLSERYTREVIIRKIPEKKAACVVAEMDKIEHSTPNFKERFKTITSDNGPEFLDYHGLCRSIYKGQRCQVYYCHSYASWEKGTIERNNRIIRRFFPKGTDFTKITEKQVADVQDWINNYPRKILGWKTALEAAG